MDLVRIFKGVYILPFKLLTTMSPNRLPIYVLIYGLKNASKNYIDISIYDCEKAYEVSSNEQFTMFMPINMNGFDILKISHYLHGYLITNLSDKTKLTE